MPRTKQLLLVPLAGICLLAAATTAQAGGLTGSEASVLHAMNAVRTSHGFAPLHVDRRLEKAARSHSADMLRRQYFAHGAFASRVLSYGARGPVLGENLAWGPDSAAWVVSRWLASPEHRANLLRPGFRRVGIGAMVGSFAGDPDAFVVTADFAGR
jgi:uncharacterized protein YkwD